jgi:hypothetical protein
MKKQKIALQLGKQKISLITQETVTGGTYQTNNPYQCVTLVTYCGIDCQGTLLTNQTSCCELSRLVC